jgi:hypothetical protein
VIILKREDLTKFGYRSNTKLKIILKPGYTLATCKNLGSKYGDFIFFFFPSKYGDFDFGRLFFPKESFVTSSDFFFCFFLLVLSKFFLGFDSLEKSIIFF